MVIEAQRGSAHVQLVNPRYDRIGDAVCCRRWRTWTEIRPGAARCTGRRVCRAARDGRRDRGAVAVLFGSAHGLREKVTAVAGPAGMAVCGAGLWASSTTRRRPRARLSGAGSAAAGRNQFITHSGFAFSTLLRAGRGFGFRLAVSSGQELVTDTADYLDYASTIPSTRWSLC